MDIGKELETITITPEPFELPRELPATPQETPVEVPERELVPA